MNHFKHPLCNGTLEPATGDEGSVDTLHVQHGSTFVHDEALLDELCNAAFKEPGLHGGLEQHEVIDVAKSYTMQMLRRYRA